MSDLYTIENGHVIVTTVTGYRVECLTYGAELMRIGSGVTRPVEPSVPFYKMGSEDDPEYAEMDQSVADDPATSDEERAAWNQYLSDQIAYDSEMAAIEERIAEARTEFIMTRCTRILDMPDLDKWAQEQREKWLIHIPEDPDEQYRQFYSMEAVKQQDASAIYIGILAASGLTQEALDQAEAIFRNSVGRVTG